MASTLSAPSDTTAPAGAHGAFAHSEHRSARPRIPAADGPCLAHVIIDPRENVWPLVPPGKNNAEMMEGA